MNVFQLELRNDCLV